MLSVAGLKARFLITTVFWEFELFTEVELGLVFEVHPAANTVTNIRPIATSKSLFFTFHASLFCFSNLGT